jgi:hypothetical protein
MSEHEEILPDDNNTPAQSHRPVGELPLERRRRLIKGGFAAPVIMTLVSRRALGGGTDLSCKSPSGFHSANASVHGITPTCTGRTPGYWKQSQHYGSWCSPYRPTTKSGGYLATPFHCTGTGFFSGPFGNMGDKTLLQVLGLGGGGVNPLARHIAAALLNAAANMTPVLNQTAVRSIWNEYVQKGYYTPTAGVRWNVAQIVTYLGQTQTL